MIKGRSERNKFPETDRRILHGQAVKQGDVENKKNSKEEDTKWRKRAKRRCG